MLTRKHFKIIAAEVAKIADLDLRKATAESWVNQCKQSNQRFDANRFLAACGL